MFELFTLWGIYVLGAGAVIFVIWAVVMAVGAPGQVAKSAARSSYDEACKKCGDAVEAKRKELVALGDAISDGTFEGDVDAAYKAIHDKWDPKIEHLDEVARRAEEDHLRAQRWIR